MTRKLKLNYILGLVLMYCLSSCAFDNYEPPKSSLKGRLVYQGEPINVSSGDVEVRLIEPGYKRVNPIPVAVAQDGSFSALLFDSNYKLYLPGGQGPYRSLINPETNSDTILVNLQGSKVMDVEVLPYYMIRNSQISSVGRKLTASFRLEKVINDANAKNVNRIFLYVSKTQFVDTKTTFATSELGGGDIVDPNNISLSVDVPQVPLSNSQTYVYARIGVRIDGVEDLIFSPIQKVTFQ